MAENRIKTGKCRASYLNVITPRAAQLNAEPKYSVALLIPKSDTDTYKRVQAAIKAALEMDREGKNKLKGVKNPKVSLHDGDGEKPNGGEYGPECKGHWVLNASNKDQPGLVGPDNEIMKDKEEWYSGIYVKADITFSAFDTAGNKGIGCYLNHIKKLKDGEALSGAGSATEAFKDDEWEDDEDSVI